MLSGATMLTKSLKISDTSKNEFMGLMFFESDQKISQNTAVEIEAVFRTV